MAIIIEAKNRWWSIGFRELWEYRNLVALFSGRSLATMYKQSALGPAWFMIQPILTAFVFYIVFGVLIKLSTGGMPHMLFYMSGMMFWHLFVNVFQQTALTLSSNSHLFGKIYFPRLVMPLSNIITAATLFALNLTTLAGFYAYYRVWGGAQMELRWSLLLLPALVAQICAAGFAFGLCVAAATVRFRDLKYMLPTIIQFWMFMTPIFYSSARISPELRKYLWLNPVAAPVEYFRYSISGANPVPLEAFAPGAALTLALLVVGLLWFNSAQRDFIDVV